MDGSSQVAENNKKKKNTYNQWTEQETDELLKLLVEATLEKRKDKSGSFPKLTIVTRILPKLNQTCQCNKTYENFKGKIRWFKNRLGQYQDMFKSSSGFGWNDDSKMIDGTDEMWNNYFEGHPTHSHLRDENGRDYRDLLFVFGNNYIMRVLREDPEDFRREYRMHSDVFRKLCYLIRDTTSVRDMKSVSVEEMLGTFLLVVGQNDRYCRVRDTFGRSRCTVTRGQRYHLQEFTGMGNHDQKKEELFNLRHASLRNVVERLFGVFKSRFTIFNSQPPFSYQVQAEIVTACAGLHNFLRKECRSDGFPVEEDSQPSSSTLVNDDEVLLQTQEHQHQEANAWRDSIANAMWSSVRYQRDLELYGDR